MTLLAAGALCVACGSSKTSASPTLSYVLVKPGFQFVNIGARAQMIAVAGYTDNSTRTVTNDAVWSTSDPSVVSILPNGRATALAVGTSTIRATYQGMSGSLVTYIGPDYYDDCYGYDPDTLRILPQGSTWALVDGLGSFIAVFATEADAANGLALGRQYRSTCYIGRGNPRPNPSAYVIEYWPLPTGQAATISPEDCVPYTPGNVRVVDQGATGWAVMDGSTQIALLDN
ncbi:MAG TPA: Ig-like domain-containing protein [Vicinamibacterales bacterium]|nr:Ig-like domain-containing protein [Vicinamibacterales bacterium]